MNIEEEREMKRKKDEWDGKRKEGMNTMKKRWAEDNTMDDARRKRRKMNE